MKTTNSTVYLKLRNEGFLFVTYSPPSLYFLKYTLQNGFSLLNQFKDKEKLNSQKSYKNLLSLSKNEEENNVFNIYFINNAEYDKKIYKVNVSLS